MDKQQVWKQLFTLQAEANNKLVGSEAWLTNKDTYDFVQCCLEEAVEAAASWGWAPWWKPAAALDMDNVKLELIDILHFHMSAVMQQAVVVMEASLNGPTLEEAIEAGVNHAVLCEPGYIQPVAVGTKPLQSYVQALLSSGPIIAMHYLVNLFEGACMSFDEAVARYLAKNALNLFRANNGYKQNKNMKYWTEGREDNEYVMEMIGRQMDSGIALDRDAILAAIGVEYERVTGKKPS